MKYIKILIFSCLIYSCSNPLDTSVLNPLEIEDLKKVIKNDTLFENLYSEIKSFRESIEDDEIQQVKWSDLTYKSFIKYKDFVKDTSFWNPQRSKIIKSYYTEYDTSGFVSKVDSISNYWRVLSQEMDLSNYVKIELVELDKEYYRSLGSLKEVKLGFRLTPLKGKLDQIVFSYDLEPKINEREKSSSYTSLYNLNRCLYSRPLYSSKIGYWECDYSDRDLLGSKSISSLKRDYNLNIIVEEIRRNGINYDKDDFDIPFSIEQLWKYESSEKQGYMIEYYKEDIFKENIDDDFISVSEYLDTKFQEIRNKKFPLENEFSKLLYEIRVDNILNKKDD
tara:strand:+ start:602 stop:1609 length:1008 start_codon:yes stop_codon:yes gene_type:complete